MKRVICAAVAGLAVLLVSTGLISCQTTESGESGMSRQGDAAVYRTTERMMDDIMGIGPTSMGPRF